VREYYVNVRGFEYCSRSRGVGNIFSSYVKVGEFSVLGFWEGNVRIFGECNRGSWRRRLLGGLQCGVLHLRSCSVALLGGIVVRPWCVGVWEGPGAGVGK
jgi:hypothetical protein